VLYQFEVPQRIAVLGMMNEMGDYSPEAHRQVGAYCDPSKLEVVVTVGADANEYLAAVAEARGCQVERCASPYEAGTYVKSLLKPGAVLLFKGSQNRGFIEEAIKSVLANPTDADHLVRQSDYWMSRKRVQFGEAAPWG
jgi:UDP-N-acetylmuramoyl-tripeptide--D-alanyl-D-alanine ligase